MNMDIATIVQDFFETLKNFFEQIKVLFESLFGGLTPGGDDDGDDD